MSEQLSIVNLVLGIVGTITGIVALFISYWTLKKESPRLEIKILKCEHDFTISKSQIKTISFWTEFQIKNLGDRGTTVNDIDLTFRDEGLEYYLKQRYSESRYETMNKTEGKWIDAHRTVEIKTNFFETYIGEDKEQINCIFTLYHTHGAISIKSISQRRKQT